MRGARGTLALLARHPATPAREFSEWRFDRSNGVRTRGELEFEEYRVSGIDLATAESYMPIQPGRFASGLAAAGVSYEGRTFVDLGSGKGRGLVLAAQEPFRRFVGVEVSPELHELAQLNIASFKRKKGDRREFELRCGDASTFRLPREDMVLFLFNPFRGEALRAVVKGIEEALLDGVRRLTVLYLTPEDQAPFDDAPFLRLVASSSYCRVYEAIPAGGCPPA
ncbi:MAG: class I SAM-dependent methyltransferase [Miltoncostaeaceae bacterium]